MKTLNFLTLCIAVILSSHTALADTPSATKIADATTMTAFARELFFAGNVTIADKDVMSRSCLKMKDLVILGCNKNLRIFILRISEPELDGVMENTAAHEMLHSGYAKLTADEREKVDELTAIAVKSVTDKDILERLARYKREGESVSNELHSILGTEVSNLPKALESYYAKYFKDRSKVVAFTKKYEARIASGHAKVKAYDQVLDKLKSEIDDRDKKLAKKKEQLDEAKRHMASLKPQDDVEGYNRAASNFNKRAHEYNAGAKIANDLSVKYKHLEKIRNDLARESNRLTEAINGRS